MTLLLANAYADSASNSGSMLFSCWAIALIIAAMSFVFLRFGKKEYSLAILPLLITPLANIAGGLFSRFLSGFIKLPISELRVMIVLTAGLFSCLSLGLCSRGISGPRTRRIFFWFCAAFIIILTLILVYNSLASS